MKSSNKPTSSDAKLKSAEGGQVLLRAQRGRGRGRGPFSMHKCPEEKVLGSGLASQNQEQACLQGSPLPLFSFGLIALHIHAIRLDPNLCPQRGLQLSEPAPIRAYRRTRLVTCCGNHAGFCRESSTAITRISGVAS